MTLKLCSLLKAIAFLNTILSYILKIFYWWSFYKCGLAKMKGSRRPRDKHDWRLVPYAKTSSHRCLWMWHKTPARQCLSGFYQRATHQTAWLEKKTHSGDIGEAPVLTFGEVITWLALEKWYMPALPVNDCAMVGNMSCHWACHQVAKSLHLTSNGWRGQGGRGGVLPTDSENKRESLHWRTSPGPVSLLRTRTW